MPIHRVGAGVFAVRTFHQSNRSSHSGGAADTAGTSYGLQFSRTVGARSERGRKIKSYAFGELTIVIPTATRGRISWAELETPIIETRARVSWIEFQTPNVITRGRVSWSELQVPNRATRGRISWTEFETPLAATRGRISQTEFQVPNRLTRGRVSWTELQVPNSPTRGLLSWSEFQVPDGFIPIDFWCALTGNSGMTGGGDIIETEKMISKLLSRTLNWNEVKYLTSIPAAGSNAIVTVAAVQYHRILIHKVFWSYSADGAGSLNVNGGPGSDFNVDITKSGPGALTLNRFGLLNTDVVITLLGIPGIQGKLNVEYTVEHG